MNEYRDDNLDITFVDNEFEDLGSDKNKEYPPFDIKNADTTEVFAGSTNNSQDINGGVTLKKETGLRPSSKLLDNDEATYLTPQSNSATTPYAGPVIEYPNSAMDRALERLSKFTPNTQLDFSNITNFAEDNVNINKILGNQLVNFVELESKPAVSNIISNIGNLNQTAGDHKIVKNNKPATPTTSKARGRSTLRPVGYVVCRFKGCNVVGCKLKN